MKRITSLLLVFAMLLSLLTACGGNTETTADPQETTSTQETTTEAPQETTESQPVETAPALTGETAYGENDILALANYTISDCAPGDEMMTAVVAVDADGESALTNSLLNILFWVEFYEFMNQYGSYATYYGLNYSTPLNQQNVPVSISEAIAAAANLPEDTTLTWEQYFLYCAVQKYTDFYCLARDAEVSGYYTMTEEDLQTLQDVVDPEGEFAAELQNAGYADADSYIQTNFGPGTNIYDYQEYMRVYSLAMGYYEKFTEAFKAATDDAAVEAYYDEYADEYLDLGYPKYNNVSVRHILIAPEGEKDATTGAYTKDQLAPAYAEAQRILEQWQTNPTADYFGELATEHTDDTSSASTGGLYEDFKYGAMVTGFNEWCFDQSRQPGDCEIVETQFGYHIIYFVEQTETQAWMDAALEDMLIEEENRLFTQLRETYPVNMDFAQVRIFDLVTWSVNALEEYNETYEEGEGAVG